MRASSSMSVSIVAALAGLAHADAPPPKAPTPSMSIDTPTSKADGFDGKAAQSVVMTSIPKLLVCYKTKTAQPSSRSVATLSVGPDGKVTKADLLAIATDTEACLKGVFAKLVFAKPRTAAAFTVSFGFSYFNGTDPAPIAGGVVGGVVGDGSDYGPGGAGSGTGSIGTGKYGTIGHGAGTGNSGYGVGGGGGGGRCGGGRATNLPSVTLGTQDVKGELDGAIVRRYIKRNINKIQYCYEKALLTNEKLAGAVTVRFKILGTGLVEAATLKTDTSPAMKEVAACVGAVVQDIEFPKPKSGVVEVKYPFTFARSN